jgi:uncharacterized protein (UPF0276 family)
MITENSCSSRLVVDDVTRGVDGRPRYPVRGAGLGLRRAHLSPLLLNVPEPIAFMEVAPENWLDVGGRLGKEFRAVAKQTMLICHGLSLNLGGPAPLDEDFLARLKQFFAAHDIRYYSEHLSYCGDEGLLYDLLPIPFTEEAVHHVASRIRRVQDILERRIAIENISYYCAPGQRMREIDFINAVLAEADCDLLLDINNIYVNSINHRYDPVAFLKALPGERIAYAHIAGHFDEADDLKIDTHGADVIDPVWRLLRIAYDHFGVFPTLLERDFNIPPLEVLITEVERIAQFQQTTTASLPIHYPAMISV